VTNALTKPAPTALSITTTPGAMTREQVDLLKRTYCKGASDDELALFAHVCNRKRLDPFSGQIHAVKRWNSDVGREVMAYQTGIDGFRSIANRTGDYDGQDPPQWCGPDRVWVDLWTKAEPPFAARMAVWRKGIARPFVGIAMWQAYVQTKKDGTPTRMWNPAGNGPAQLAKCAEAQALRKAFPEDETLGGLYAHEEMPEASMAPAPVTRVAEGAALTALAAEAREPKMADVPPERILDVPVASPVDAPKPTCSWEGRRAELEPFLRFSVDGIGDPETWLDEHAELSLPKNAPEVVAAAYTTMERHKGLWTWRWLSEGEPESNRHVYLAHVVDLSKSATRQSEKSKRAAIVLAMIDARAIQHGEAWEEPTEQSS
jgi:phage recombination protein Bet